MFWVSFGFGSLPAQTFPPKALIINLLDALRPNQLQVVSSSRWKDPRLVRKAMERASLLSASFLTSIVLKRGHLLKSFSNVLQHTKHSSNTLEPLHLTIQQSASCQNVSSFLSFLKLGVLVDSSSDSYNIVLRPLQYQLIEVEKECATRYPCCATRHTSTF